MEAALASIGLLSPATVTRANERLARFETLAGSTPGELLQVANVACWKWAAGTAAETVEHGRRALAAARAQAADASDSIPIYEALWVLCYADAHELALSVLDDTLADARARGSVFGISTSCALRALIALQRGDVTAAEQEARTAAVLPGLSGFVRPPLFGVLAQALVARGDLDGAERAIARERLRAEPARVRLPEPRLLRARRAAARAGPPRGGARRLHRVRGALGADRPAQPRRPVAAGRRRVPAAARLPGRRRSRSPTSSSRSRGAGAHVFRC